MADATDELLKQVSDQCRVVAHLATSIASVHSDYARLMEDPACGGAMRGIADQVGVRTASLMETLGNILNGMDAVTEDDDWTHPIFREAHRRWPQAAAQPHSGR